MLTVFHAATGLGLASYIKQPGWLCVSAIAMHYILDALPHWDNILPKSLACFFKPSWLWVDFILALTLTFGLPILASVERPWMYWLAGIISASPDGLTFIGKFLQVPFLEHVLGPSSAYYRFNEAIQWKVAFWPGILSQAIVLVIMMFLFYLAYLGH